MQKFCCTIHLLYCSKVCITDIAVHNLYNRTQRVSLRCNSSGIYRVPRLVLSSRGRWRCRWSYIRADACVLVCYYRHEVRRGLTWLFLFHKWCFLCRPLGQNPVYMSSFLSSSFPCFDICPFHGWKEEESERSDSRDVSIKEPTRQEVVLYVFNGLKDNPVVFVF